MFQKQKIEQNQKIGRITKIVGLIVVCPHTNPYLCNVFLRDTIFSMVFASDFERKCKANRPQKV